MIKKIVMALLALLIIVLLAVSGFIYYVSGWEERAIHDTLNKMEIVTNNIGTVTEVTLDSDADTRQTRAATIIAAGKGGTGILTGTISPTDNESEFRFDGIIKFPAKAYNLSFNYSGISKYKGNINYSHGKLKGDLEKVN